MMTKRLFSLALVLPIFFLLSCNHIITVKQGDIFISDGLSIFKVNPLTGERKKIVNDQIADVSYNKEKHALFSTHRKREGFSEYHENKVTQCNTGLAAPNYLYSYKNYVLSDSWIIHHDSAGEQMGKFGIYDISKKKLVKEFKEYGSFDAITGYQNMAYVTMFGSEKNNSNVYEVDLNTLTMRPIFHTPQSRAPKILHDDKGNSYGFYKHWGFGPANELVELNVKTGEKKEIAKLDPYAFNATLIGDSAVVVHLDSLNEGADIRNCITTINLKTGNQSKMQIPDIRPTNIITYDEETVAITDENGYLLLVNPFEKRVVKKHFISEGLLFLAATT